MSKRFFFPRSLRWRLQIGSMLLLVCVLTGFGVAVYQLQKVNRFAQIDGELESRISALSGSLRDLYLVQGPPPFDDEFGGPPRNPPPDGQDFGGRGFDGRGFKGRGPEGRGGNHDFDDGGRGRHGPPPSRESKPADLALPPQTAALFGAGRNDYYYVVWYRDGSILKRSPAAPADLTRPVIEERDTLPHLRTRGHFREDLHCSGMGDCALTGRSVEADLIANRDFAWILLGAGGAMLVLTSGLSLWFTSRAIRPIEKISTAASRISHGNLSERVDGANSGDELGNLAAVLNSTFARLESAFARQREFTADAAHELRTPLAVIISEAQTTLARERTSAEYRETVESCLDMAQQMRRLTESLLELARFDADQAHPQTDVDLAEAARVCVERVLPVAAEHGIRIESDLTPARALVNSDRICQVISNLITNAIFYNRLKGSVRVTTYTENDTAVIAVKDTGVGIGSADLPRIFDRFYRVDKARSRAEGHTGLGLAISKAILDSEGGTIEVASVLGEGTRFTVRLPAIIH